ncbi:MAG: glutathione synthase [Thermodesulfobacteriota bacterium]
MILSFHPCFSGDRFINCGGRGLTTDDIDAMKSASAVILPQACRKELYEAARTYCPRVFPDFNKKFAYPGKTGQIRLFRETGTPHPETRLFAGTAHFQAGAEKPDATSRLEFPAVFKLNGADEGHGVFLVKNPGALPPLLELAAKAEKAGEPGFLLQQYIETGGRVLRVCVIYKTIRAYWRVSQNPSDFRVNLSRGAVIDETFRPDLRDMGVAAVKKFCDQTGINLAGFDLVFSHPDPTGPPLFLEINYYFGRRGLGGTRPYYQLLTREIKKWLNDQERTGAAPLSGTQAPAKRT